MLTDVTTNLLPTNILVNSTVIQLDYARKRVSDSPLKKFLLEQKIKTNPDTSLNICQ
jgi:hypothetical protein